MSDTVMQGNAPQSRGNPNKYRKKKKSSPVKKTFAIIGTTLLSLILIVIITGSIVATALTVYVMQFMDTETAEIDLYNLNMASASYMYAYDKDGNEVELMKISQDADREIVSIDQIPKYVRNAFVAVEDERFYDHEGVDFKRTFGAFVNEMLGMFGMSLYGGRQGGSTITQQLVKNVTQDDDPDFTRKIREIFRAMNLEEYYTKDDILEAYLNYIGFGGNTYGVQAASQRYFGKDVWDISLAQAASLAAIPKDPNVLNPERSPEKNKERQEVVLNMMLKNSFISDQEYNEALAADLELVSQKNTQPSPNGDGQENENAANDSIESPGVAKGVTSYFEDAVITEVCQDLMEKYGYKDETAAYKALAEGGYRIYTTVDIEMQRQLEAKFMDMSTFATRELEDPPQAAFVCLDYQGNILGVVGGIGEKTQSRSWNRATMSPRSVGSCIKPVSTYGYGIYSDMINWSSVFIDEPITVRDGHVDRLWPTNYSNTYAYSGFFMFQALQKSLNTVPAQIMQRATPEAVWDFTTNRMKISTLTEEDRVNYSPLTVGGLTKGITLLELTSAYQAFGNLGKIYEPTTYTKVLDADGKVILEHAYTPFQALDEDSAYVMNRLLRQVITSGTGTAANIPGVEVIGKTGTSQDWADILFVGCTPNYVAGMWYGYDDAYTTDANGNTVANSTQNTFISSSGQVWRNIFGDIAAAAPPASYPENNRVRQLRFCSVTGKIAGPSCTPSPNVGYYKPSNVPSICYGDHSHGVGVTFGGNAVTTVTTVAGETSAPDPNTTTPPIENNAPPEQTTPPVTTAPSPETTTPPSETLPAETEPPDVPRPPIEVEDGGANNG